MEEMVGLVSTCGRELLWGWWRLIDGEFYDFYSISLEYFGYHHVWMSCLMSTIYGTPVDIGQGTSVRKDMN
jgi:hypothetical protein